MAERRKAFRERVEKDQGERERREHDVARLIAAAAATNASELATCSSVAAPREIRRWREAVRGFRWSIDQSAMRLNSIAAVRAQIMQRSTSRTSRGEGRPWVATRSAPSAKGSAKTCARNG